MNTEVQKVVDITTTYFKKQTETLNKMGFQVKETFGDRDPEDGVGRIDYENPGKPGYEIRLGVNIYDGEVTADCYQFGYRPDKLVVSYAWDSEHEQDWNNLDFKEHKEVSMEIYNIFKELCEYTPSLEDVIADAHKWDDEDELKELIKYAPRVYNPYKK